MRPYTKIYKTHFGSHCGYRKCSVCDNQNIRVAKNAKKSARAAGKKEAHDA